jgi:exopolysaccharide biosynthesis protein
VRNPRTGICVLKNGQELLVTVDGRYYYAAGMTVAEFALFMQALGCKSAINLGAWKSFITGFFLHGKLVFLFFFDFE